MPMKTIEFESYGGKHTQRLNIREKNMPVSASCSENWAHVSSDTSSVTVSADRHDGILDRECQVELSDRFGNTIPLRIVQHGFTDVRIDCPDMVAIPYTHYLGKDSYDVYVTSYGGSCGIKAKGMARDTENVWNLSGTYRDYILHIPKGKSGSVTITHSDSDEYREWCESVGIPFDESRVRRKMTIVQLSKDDMDGHVTLSGDTLSETDFGYSMQVSHAEGATVKARCSYSTVLGDGSVGIVCEDTAYISDIPEWISCTSDKDKTTIKALRPNPFANERRARLKVASPSNPKLHAILEVVQESSVAKD